MKTRIISGAVLIIIVSAVVFSTLFFNLPLIFTLFLAVVSPIASYEMLNNTGIVKSKMIIAAAVIYSALAQFIHFYIPSYLWCAVLIYGTISLLFCFKDKLSYKKTLLTVLFPPLVNYCFYCVSGCLSLGLVHLLLLLNFSSVCDCGAYFVGVTFGKHKLCPKISPKKTVEGALGGITLSMIVTFILAKIFSVNAIGLVLVTPLLCIAGIAGDLFASVIKRRVGIKDYGKLIPGHGGIMDRFDSILLIAPIYIILYSLVG